MSDTCTTAQKMIKVLRDENAQLKRRPGDLEDFEDLQRKLGRAVGELARYKATGSPPPPPSPQITAATVQAAEQAASKAFKERISAYLKDCDSDLRRALDRVKDHMFANYQTSVDHDVTTQRYTYSLRLPAVEIRVVL